MALDEKRMNSTGFYLFFVTKERIYLFLGMDPFFALFELLRTFFVSCAELQTL